MIVGVPNRTRIAWNPERLGLYLDSCLEEAAKGRRRSGNLTPESWQKVQSVFKEKTNIDLTPTQLSNFWSVLRKRYMVWSKIIAEAGNGGYDPVANKINWNQKQWEEYIKVDLTTIYDLVKLIIILLLCKYGTYCFVSGESSCKALPKEKVGIS